MSNQLHSLTLKKLNAKYCGTGYTFAKISGVMGFEISFDGLEIYFMEVPAYLLHLDRTMKECPFLNGETCELPNTKVELRVDEIALNQLKKSLSFSKIDSELTTSTLWGSWLIIESGRLNGFSVQYLSGTEYQLRHCDSGYSEVMEYSDLVKMAKI